MGTDSGETGTGCVLAAAPRGGCLDRLARALEGGGRGEAVQRLADLGEVLPPAALAKVDDGVVEFYRTPMAFALRAGVEMGRWSRLLMGLFAFCVRQSRAPDRGRGSQAYAVCQRLYRDDRGRTHWDRYVRVDGRLQRLFVARMSVAPGRVYETFVLYGLPVTLAFQASADGDALLLTLLPRESSLLARTARVTYRTAPTEAGHLHTTGHFRVPLLGLAVQMQFQMHPQTSAQCRDH